MVLRYYHLFKRFQSIILDEVLRYYHFFPAHKLFAKKQWKGLTARRIFSVGKCSGVEWSGVEWSGVGGVEWSIVEWSGVEWVE